jgi:DNA-binding NarL/FixJ family response regulator
MATVMQGSWIGSVRLNNFYQVVQCRVNRRCAAQTGDVVLRLAVVDDRPLLRAGVAAAVAVPLVGEHGTLAEAQARLPISRPNVVIVRAELPDGSGLDLCRWLRGTDAGARCLVLHHRPTRRDLLDAIDAGAAGFADDDVDLVELRSALGRLAQGETLLGGAELATLAARLPAGPDATALDRWTRLDTAQRALVELVAAGHTNAEIGRQLGLAEQTVKNKVSRILGVMGLERRTQLAALALTTRR